MIKLYTGASTGANSFIYDETFPEEAISTNGRHQGVVIIINEVEGSNSEDIQTRVVLLYRPQRDVVPRRDRA